MSNYNHRRCQVNVFVFHVHGMAEGSVSSVVVPLGLLSRVCLTRKEKKQTQLKQTHAQLTSGVGPADPSLERG